MLHAGALFRPACNGFHTPSSAALRGRRARGAALRAAGASPAAGCVVAAALAAPSGVPEVLPLVLLAALLRAGDFLAAARGVFLAAGGVTWSLCAGLGLALGAFTGAG